MPLALQKTDQGRRGSEWGLSQMEWLGVKFEWDPDLDHVLRQDSEFQPDWQLQRSIINVLYIPWEDIIKSKGVDNRSLCANLLRLAHIRKPLHDYEKSSTIEGLSSMDWRITARIFLSHSEGVIIGNNKLV